MAGSGEDGLQRAEELYSGMCAENPDDEHLWIALFRIHKRTGSSGGLEAAMRRYQTHRSSWGTTDVTDIDKAPLPPNLQRMVNEMRSPISATPAA